MIGRNFFVAIGVLAFLGVFAAQGLADETSPNRSEDTSVGFGDGIGAVVSEEELEENRPDQSIEAVAGEADVPGDATHVAGTGRTTNISVDPPGQEQARPDVSVLIPISSLITAVTGSGN